MIAKIAVSAATFAFDKPYSYLVPQGMELQAGMRVIVPFGRGNRRSEGLVLSLEEEPVSRVKDSGMELKSVEQRLDEEPVLTEYMLRMAVFLRERCFCTLYDAVRAILPAGLWFQSKESYRLAENAPWQDKQIRQPEALILLNHLQDLGGEASETALRLAVPDEMAFQNGLQYLLKKKWILGKQDYSRKTNDKTEKIATLVAPVEEVIEYASRCLRAPMQKSVLELLCGIGSASVKEICYYTGAATATVKRLEKMGYLELSDKPVLRCREIQPAKLGGPLTLNAEQQVAFDGLYNQMHLPMPGCALLYGVTGSGKTSVYIKLIQACLNEGKTAVLLVPEIALTPQLLSLLVAHFGNQVAILHSSLSTGERYDQWKRARRGDAKVVVGTRSAVFAPCPNLGLMILDEEQEHSYKSENNPRYTARDVALWRGIKEKALVLFGSATPSVETMYRAKNGDYRLYTLKHRYNGKALPDVQIVDMRQEVENGNDLDFSLDLLEAMAQTRAEEKQTILFLNRRGNSRALVCVDCRESPECPRCSARLTYHSANQRLMCHYCGFSQPAQERCPHCGGQLKRIGTGTQKLQQQLENLYPGIQIDRMDTDTISAVNTHEKILEHFKKENVPVLIGTQMVAKGLNLPDVTLVGVLDADLSLHMGGYRAAETTFNMLTQVVGRAGRGDVQGKAIIQTMVPEHKVILLAAQQDYEGFYKLEIGLRRSLDYPPFGDIGSVTFIGQEEGRVLRGAVKFRDSLSTCLKSPGYESEVCRVLGPAPCTVPKINYNFRYRLTLRCTATRILRGLLAHLLRQFAQDSENRGITAYCDMNGYDE